jgi:predicted PurR-regulated permease PerM
MAPLPVGLGLLGEPYFFVVALIAAAGTIPIVGPVIGGVTAWPWPCDIGAVGGQVASCSGAASASQRLVPKIMQQRVGISPVAVIVALLVGGELWGLVGAVLAIPTAAIVSAFIEEFTARVETAL